MDAEKDKRLQWHPPFYAGMQIEFEAEADNLTFENEHQLSTKPLGIDILIIKKDADIPIRKNIGRIFRKYNIVEYKSGSDYLGIDDFYKVYAYASLYKALARHEDEIKTGEITITFISHHFPHKLKKYLEKERGYYLIKSGEGIYRINGNAFAMQIIVTSRISKEENLWLWSISNPVRDEETVGRLIGEYEKNKDNEHYESVMDIIVRTNEKMFRLEDERVCEALEEILKDRIEAKVEEKVEERVKAELEERVKAELEKRVKAELEKRVEAEVSERVEAEVSERVEAEVSERVEAEVAERVETEVAVRLEAEAMVKEKVLRADFIMEQLEEYGEIPRKLKEKIYGEKNTGVLKRWLKAAAKADSLMAFERAM